MQGISVVINGPRTIFFFFWLCIREIERTKRNEKRSGKKTKRRMGREQKGVKERVDRKQKGERVENKKEWKESVFNRDSILENKFAVLGGFARCDNLSVLGGFPKGHNLSSGFSLV